MKLIYHPIKAWCVQSKSGEVALSEFCQQQRTAKAWSCAHVASESGLSISSYLKFESGTIKSLNTGLLVLQALGYDIFLLGGKQL